MVNASNMDSISMCHLSTTLDVGGDVVSLAEPSNHRLGGGILKNKFRHDSNDTGNGSCLSNSESEGCSSSFNSLTMSLSSLNFQSSGDKVEQGGDELLQDDEIDFHEDGNVSDPGSSANVIQQKRNLREKVGRRISVRFDDEVQKVTFTKRQTITAFHVHCEKQKRWREQRRERLERRRIEVERERCLSECNGTSGAPVISSSGNIQLEHPHADQSMSTPSSKAEKRRKRRRRRNRQNSTSFPSPPLDNNHNNLNVNNATSSPSTTGDANRQISSESQRKTTTGDTCAPIQIQNKASIDSGVEETNDGDDSGIIAGKQ